MPPSSSFSRRARTAAAAAVSASSMFDNGVLLGAALAALIVLIAAMLFFGAGGGSDSSGRSGNYFWLPRQVGVPSAQPPLQDNLDRLIPNPDADVLFAPTGLARLRAQGGGGGGGILPTSVRPPIDKTYRQVGVISRQRGDGKDTNNADLDILPLMGQWLHGDSWRYFTVTGGGAGGTGVRLPVQRDTGAAPCDTPACAGLARARGGSGKRCNGEYGCPELNDRDLLVVPGFQDKFQLQMYENGTFFA
jgi:hypothetical protein